MSTIQIMDMYIQQRYIVLDICYENDTNVIYNNTYYSCFMT